MDTTITLAQLLPFALALIAASAVAGIMAGIFGIGGGAILVPVLYQFLTILGVDQAVLMHVCIGTSLAIIIPTSYRSFKAHLKNGAVDVKLLRQWLFAVPLGVVVASVIAASISSAELRAIFAAIAVLVAMRLLFNRENWRIGTNIPGNPTRALVGFVVGFLSTLMGIGGGVLTNTFMTLYNRPIHQAVATSSGVGLLISVPAAIGFMWAGWGAENLPPFSIGYVNFAAVIMVIPITMLVAPLGAKLAHRLNKRQLEIGFGLFLLLVAARYIYSLV